MRQLGVKRECRATFQTFSRKTEAGDGRCRIRRTERIGRAKVERSRTINAPGT